MNDLKVLKLDHANDWKKIIKNAIKYDFYHLPFYHSLAEERGEGIAHLFVYSEGEYFAALPLLLRPIDNISGLEKVGNNLWDATSVYGYAGPIFSHQTLSDSFIQNFQNSLKDALFDRNVISVFSRLHPFIPQIQLLKGIGDVKVIGVTISIDLTLSLEDQKRQYSKGHKSGINKLKNLGVVCIHDEKLEYIDEFIDIYYETMDRVNAKKYYYFDKYYFEKFIKYTKDSIHLFVCFLEGKMMCGGMYVKCNDIVQSFLGGMRQEYKKLAPRKLEKDTVRIWAKEHGAHIFHLGGGVGSKRDSLYEFKAGFSNKRHDFHIWKWVVNQDLYDMLCDVRNKIIIKDSDDTSYFPAYRAT